MNQIFTNQQRTYCSVNSKSYKTYQDFDFQRVIRTQPKFFPLSVNEANIKPRKQYFLKPIKKQKSILEPKKILQPKIYISSKNQLSKKYFSTSNSIHEQAKKTQMTKDDDISKTERHIKENSNQQLLGNYKLPYMNKFFFASDNRQKTKKSKNILLKRNLIQRFQQFKTQFKQCLQNSRRQQIQMNISIQPEIVSKKKVKNHLPIQNLQNNNDSKLKFKAISQKKYANISENSLIRKKLTQENKQKKEIKYLKNHQNHLINKHNLIENYQIEKNYQIQGWENWIGNESSDNMFFNGVIKQI